MQSEPFIPGKKMPRTPETRERVVLVVVPEGIVRADIKNLEKKGVPVQEQVVTIEFAYGDNEMALADYKFSDGEYHLVKKYDKNVHWPDKVTLSQQPVLDSPRENPEQVAHGVKFLVKERESGVAPVEAPRPPAPPVILAGASKEPSAFQPSELVAPIAIRASLETERDWELVSRYFRLVAQIEDAQLKIEQAKVTGHSEEIPIQTRRLEIGQKNLEQFLGHHPQYRGLPKPMEIHKIDLNTVEGRNRAKALLLNSDLSAVEAGKRIIALEKAEAKIDLLHPQVQKGVGTSAVRPPLKTVLTDLKEAQYLVGRLNSVGLFSQLQNAERRHNNLLRLKSTRQSLEYILKRFTPPPHTDPNLSRDFLSLIHGVVDAVKKLEQGTNQNFLSRWWSQNELAEQNKRIIQGLKKLDQFTQEHKEFA